MSFVHNKILKALKENGIPFLSNDNISAYVSDLDRELLKQEFTEKYRELLDILLIDWRNDHNADQTAERVAKMYFDETFAGRYTSAPKMTSFPNAKKLDQLYVVGPVEVRSTCAHHHQGILGNAWVGVVPGENVIGLSKFHRLCAWINARPQIQEEATIQIADALMEQLKPKALAVVIKAKHMCTALRGVEQCASNMTTAEIRGDMRHNDALRAEFYSLIQKDL
jgi:GTP cyclohydrolase I